MEDWQQWQIRADQIAAELNGEVDRLQADFFEAETAPNLRGFWPRFRDLKERVRVAPAIKLEDKLELERRLRTLGNRAYKGQEAAYEQSGQRKTELLERIEQVAAAGASEESPRSLRAVRKELDGVREQFDKDASLMPPDRQAVWDAWRDANQRIWQRLTDIWSTNETYLRDLLQNARDQLERGNGNAAVQSVGRFFEQLRSHEARQDATAAMKKDAEGIRREAEELEERKITPIGASRGTSTVPAADRWRADLVRNQETASRLSEDVRELERQFQESASILDQAMIRGSLVDKRQKLAEAERTIRGLEQKISQSEEAPLITTG